MCYIIIYMEQNLDLSIIIVSWNSEKALKKCLASIYQLTTEISFEVIVIDNASSDQTAKMVMNDFSQVKIAENPKNFGFATAVNQGIAVSKGRYICLLNPDTWLVDRSFEQMVRYMDKFKGIGIIGPHLINPDQTTQPSVRRFPELIDQLLILLKIHTFLPDLKPLYRYFWRDFDYGQTQEVEQVMGACMMIRRQVIDELGILDEKFFIWFEDVEFCRRVFDYTDYSIYYYAESPVVHEGGESFSKVITLQKQLWYLKSLLYYLKKHRQFFSYLVILFIAPSSLFLAFLTDLISNSDKGKKYVQKKQNKIKQRQL